MSRRTKSSSGDTTDEHGYMNMGVVTNNSKPVFETAVIERHPENGHAKWSQIWRKDSRGLLFITWDSRVGDIENYNSKDL